MNLFPRFRRQSRSLNTPNSTAFPVEAQSSQAIQQKIHPNLNALEAELTLSTPEKTISPKTSGDATPPQVSLKPWIPKKPWAKTEYVPEDSITPHSFPESMPSESFGIDTAPTTSTTSRRLPIPAQSSTSLASHDTNETTPPSLRTADTILRRVVSLSTSPNMRPPSAWNGLMKRGKSRRKNPIPHASDFGFYTPEVSSPSPDEQLSGDDTPHSRSSSTTPPKNQSPTINPPTTSPPSATFTFGRRGPSSPDTSIPPLPLSRPALSSKLFNDWPDAVVFEYDFRFKFPRTAVSMPMLNIDAGGNRKEDFVASRLEGNRRRSRSVHSSVRVGDNRAESHIPSFYTFPFIRFCRQQSLGVLGRTQLEGPFDNPSYPLSRYSETEMPSDFVSTPSRRNEEANSGQSVRGQSTVTSHSKSTTSASATDPQSDPFMANSANPQTPSQSKGKRKADEVEPGGNTPPEARKQKATFANDPRPHRISGASGSSSQAPSSYTRKRARLSAPPNSVLMMPAVGEGSPTRPDSRPPSRNDSQRHGSNTGSWSRGSRTGGVAPHRTQSRASQGSQHHGNKAPLGVPGQSTHATSSRAPSRRGSISQASIPISALISPHAPSISTNGRATTFHMRDPRKPPRIQSTPWSLSFPQVGYGEKLDFLDRLKIWSLGRNGDEESQREPNVQLVGWTESGGSPLHAWLFFIGFILFPVWWVAAILGIPKTRRIGGGQEDKKMTLDDPQVEHDAMSWRRRCR
ncbi:hypothetical protein L218DRAFT_986842, partial [Marasmius fiardii PR-910]